MRFIDREEVARRLTYEVCIPIVREAMIALSPGAMGASAPFGAKLISVFQENFAKGKQSHQGLVILFDPETGAPVCVVDAGEITAIRTAAASAVATAAPSRPQPPGAWQSWGMESRPRPTRERSARCVTLNLSRSGGVPENAPGPSRNGCKPSLPCRS